MHAFIVRPFGIKNGIDFERVENELIGPALEDLGISGRTTGEFIQQGNIRSDMFKQLLVADLVVADISIHNANAFYELGIRHAFRDMRSFLIKSEGDEVPFDLKTDRYLAYDADNPAASLSALIDALKATLDSHEQDSPVFQLLPGLEPADPASFQVVPRDFREEVEEAESSKNTGYLQLLSAEVDGFDWTTIGLRLIGHAQFQLKDLQGARTTWEEVRRFEDMDLEANTILGTVFQRRNDLVKSDHALQRALQNRAVSSYDRAEIRALMARNAKTLWEMDWNEFQETGAVQKEALASAHLEKSFDLYRKGFVEDRNHFYSGLNALAMVTVMTELADAQPEVWEDDFDSEEEAALKLRKLKEFRSDLASGVKLAIESKRNALEREEQTDIWAEISAADLLMLSSTKTKRVGRAYKKALAGAPDFASDSARKQLSLYQRLGILTENTQAALDNIPEVERKHESLEEAPPRVILFTGHRIDAPDRAKPRFPPNRVDQARAMIEEKVTEVKEKTTGKLLGISGGASGGDILFHEICQELDIPSQMYLVLPKNEYIKASVTDGGPGWVERFKRLFEQKHPEILSDSGELPRWLRAKKDYTIWQRSNLWMLHSALAISQDDLTLIALWNGKVGDGPGGTEDMVKRTQDRGANFIHLDACKLIE
jgi:hypothetical protein